MAQAFKDLGALAAEPTDERPADFELQMVVLHGQERLLHFDVAHHSQGSDLVQLNDGSRFRIRGLERRLWSPDPAAWCVP